MAYDFVKFLGNYPRGDNKISIQKSGLIRLSPGFCRETGIKSFRYVILFYDGSNRAIAFKFTNVNQAGALKVTKDRNSATISAKSFIKANNLDLRSFLGRYNWKKQEISGIGEVFIVELGKK